jgi:MFS family permease
MIASWITFFKRRSRIARGNPRLLSRRERKVRAKQYLVVAGVSIATPSSLVPLVLAEAVGLKRLGTLYGWMQVFATSGLFGGPLIAGQLYDLTHSYATGFKIAALIAVAGAVAAFLCITPQAVNILFGVAAHLGSNVKVSRVLRSARQQRNLFRIAPHT